MAPPSASYEPRAPAQRVLYQIVHDHFETFRAQAAGLRGADGLPRFVEQEFREFLRCGWLAGGFARFQCVACGLPAEIPAARPARAPPLADVSDPSWADAVSSLDARS